MSWRLCTISEQSAGNWALCKEHELWGLARTPYKIDPNRAQQGDGLLFWQSGAGFLGHGIVTGKMYAPDSHDDVPWPGGLYRWGMLVPMKVVYECPTPIRLRFIESKMDRTGISLFALRRGFIAITDEQAEGALQVMKEKDPQY